VPALRAFADPGSYFSAETAQAVKESGMRGDDRAHGVRHGSNDDGQSSEGLLSSRPMRRSFVPTKWSPSSKARLDGRLKAWFSIRVPVAMSDDLLRRLGKLAEKRGVGIIGHAL